MGAMQWASAAVFQIGLTEGRPPVAAVSIASINHEGIVFSPAPGQADYKRYHWRDFSAGGLLLLKRIIKQQRAYQQRSIEERALFDDSINLQLAKIAPPPEPPKAVPAPQPEIKPKPKPEPAPVRIAPAPQPVPVAAAVPVPSTNQPAPPPKAPNPPSRPREPEPASAPPFQLAQPPGVSDGIDHRPPESSLSFSAIFSPAGVFFLLVVMGFSIYAGNEIARFRNRPKALVCAVSAICPVIGPAVFLLLPDPAAQHADAMAETHDPLALRPTTGPVTETVEPATTPINYEDDPDSPYLNMLSDDETYLEPEPAAAGVQVLEYYHAPEYQFDYNFFNDYFQRFVNATPEDGQSLVLKTRDLEYPVYYITLLDTAALSIVYPSGHEWAEETLAYELLEEVEVRGPAAS